LEALLRLFFLFCCFSLPDRWEWGAAGDMMDVDEELLLELLWSNEEDGWWEKRREKNTHTSFNIQHTPSTRRW
jgi:hypothetical protein